MMTITRASSLGMEGGMKNPFADTKEGRNEVEATSSTISVRSEISQKKSRNLAFLLRFGGCNATSRGKRKETSPSGL
jgi:hypothetical protein